MKKQINQRWQSSLLAIIAIVLAFGAFSGAAVAQETKSIFERYGSRNPRSCEDTKAPARGAITAALAAKYISCQMEFISIGDLYLIENLKSVEVGGGVPYNPTLGAFEAIDVRVPLYPIRGSYLRYQCRNQLTEYVGPPNTNCITYNSPKATGYCYKTTFGDWRCNMNDSAANNAENIRRQVAPPKGANNAAEETPNEKPAGTNPKQPVNPKDTKQTAGTKDAPDAADRDENGFVKPDFSEMEKYFEIVKYEYDFFTNSVLPKLNFIVKPKVENAPNSFTMKFTDADGVTLGNYEFYLVRPFKVGEPMRASALSLYEKDMKKVKSIKVYRKVD